ncbi:MAG: UDP-N-acetylmuramoyl-L-alanine--D-glutamate ligase [Ginsengibacter sp.]|jgi:UDP-N-acetylmuramoylalanine--D-glutamate ligase
MKKKMIILGAGESGTGAALLAKQQGFDVFVSEGKVISPVHRNELIDYSIDFEEGSHSTEKILRADVVVKSPGIPEKNELVQLIRKQGIEIISEIEFAWRYKGNSKVIAITGSNGKTTTTAMIGHIFETAKINSATVGNIGYSFARQIAMDPKSVYIVEVSSFQLDDIKTFKPDVSVLTNITEDHLDRYEYLFENYIESKFNIIKNQTAEDVFIYNADDEVTSKYLKRFLNEVKPVPISMSKQLPEGAYIVNEQMHLKWLKEEMTMSIDDFAVKGKHNQYNTMAAGLSAVVMGIRKEKIRDAVKTFESLDHRMSLVATIKGVDFINDSKATNTNSTWYALESMTKPTILILGGVDKGNNYDFMKDLVKEKVKAIVCMGLDNSKIHEAFEEDIPLMIDTKSAREAVQAAFQLSEKGDVVLLSPACASFDLFANYEDRGFQFIEAVKNL